MKTTKQFLSLMLFLFVFFLSARAYAYTGQYSWDPLYIAPTQETTNSQTEQRLKSQYGITAYYGCYPCTYTDTSNPYTQTSCLSQTEYCLEKKAMQQETSCSAGYVYLNGRCVTIDAGCKEQYGVGSYYRGVKDENGKYSCDCSSGYEWNSDGSYCMKSAAASASNNTSSSSGGNGSPATPSIPEGAIMKTADNPDVYIVKYVGNKKFKRLILSPSVFKSYGHLKWENIITVSQSTMDSFVTSDLVRAVGDLNIYRLFPQGDQGEKRLVPITFGNNSFDTDSIYEINSVDRDSYITVGA